MSVLPNTTTKGADRRCPLYALLTVALLALALSGEAFLRSENFSGGETISPRRLGRYRERREQPPPAAGRGPLGGAARSGLRVPERRGAAERGGHGGSGERDEVAARKFFVVEE